MENIEQQLNTEQESEKKAQKEEDIIREETESKEYLFKKGMSGNPKGRPKGSVFSIRADLIKALKSIKKKNPKKYQEIIESYFDDAKHRQFLLEIIDGKAKQQTEISGDALNPVRIISVKPLE